ncbi:MAG: hypothetical protein J5J00_06010 [Deltaproteobacteria bacterium]|nr:hypothetical protein [Deltaproteobacteria bacterium]
MIRFRGAAVRHRNAVLNCCNQQAKVTPKGMLGKPGPFQIIDVEGDASCVNPSIAPRRRYDCNHYDTCLNIAAALNWDNFTCRGCCGEIDEALFWRARQASKKDVIAGTLCDIPSIKLHTCDEPEDRPRKIVNKE